MKTINELKESKIFIHNKDHCKAVIDRIYKLINVRFKSDFLEINGRMCGMIYIHNHNRICWDRENYDSYPNYKTITLDDLYNVEKERKKIALYEYVTNFGVVRYLTENKEELWFSDTVRRLGVTSHPDNAYKIPNGRVIYAYADDLTYCEGE